MATSEIIKTKRLIIEPFTERYLTERYVGWLRDSKVVKYSELRHRQHTLDSCRKYMESFRDSPHYFWAISVRNSQGSLTHIGNMNAYVDSHNSTADIGILIGEHAAWGKGFGSEAWIAVCNYLVNKVGLRKITAGTMAKNKGMIKVMQKAGMKHDGRRKKHFLLNNKEVDLIHMAIFRNTWNSKR
jgi:RimJ/RimL family protein N-acetyltransferase